jgi:hypothetical protein
MHIIIKLLLIVFCTLSTVHTKATPLRLSCKGVTEKTNATKNKPGPNKRNTKDLEITFFKKKAFLKGAILNCYVKNEIKEYICEEKSLTKLRTLRFYNGNNIVYQYIDTVKSQTLTFKGTCML